MGFSAITVGAPVDIRAVQGDRPGEVKGRRSIYGVLRGGSVLRTDRLNPHPRDTPGGIAWAQTAGDKQAGVQRPPLMPSASLVRLARGCVGTGGKQDVNSETSYISELEFRISVYPYPHFLHTIVAKVRSFDKDCAAL